MTPDDPRPSTPDDTDTGAAASRDELASALVDGVLSADDAAEARRRPDVAARAAAIESSRAALRAVPPADSAARERAIAAALATFDEAASYGAPTGDATPGPTLLPTADPGAARDDTPTRLHTAGDDAGADEPAAAPTGAASSDPDISPGTGHPPTAGPNDTPTRLHTVHAGPDGRRAAPRRPRWLGAAAAVAVLVGAAGLAAVNSGGSDDESSDMAVSAPDEAAEESTRDAAGGAGEDGTRASADAPPAGTGDSAQSLPALPDIGDLGSFASEADLAAHVESLLLNSPLVAESAPSSSPDEIAPSAGAFDELAASCPGGLPPGLADGAGEVRLRGRAVVDGRQVDVWVVDAGGGDRLVALDTACAAVVDRSLP